MSNYLFNFLIVFLICVLVAPIIIKLMQKLKYGQNILHYVEAHKGKQGTPTMGGLIFLLGLLISYLVSFSKNNRLATLLLLSTLAYGLLGFLDDFLKVKLKHNEGLKAYQKFIGQFGIATIIAMFVYCSNLVGNSILIPFSHYEVELGWWIIPFIIFFYLAVTNSVNLTDGLDGLAGKVSFNYLITFSIIIIIFVGEINNIGDGVIVDEVKSMVILAFGLCGGILAFLVYNVYPAKIFMGDTGSLALGGFIATYAVLTKFYLLMPIIGLMFVLSVLSVIMQVAYYKKTKKRIFKMAPLHHHFEKCGIMETKIVSVYSIITLFIGLICIWLTLTV